MVSQQMANKKIVTSIAFYLLIVFSCLAGAWGAQKAAFEKEIVFIAYVAVSIYAMLEIFFSNNTCIESKIIFLRCVFPVMAFICSFALLRTPVKMILDKELDGPAEKFTNIETHIEPSHGGYLVSMKFEMSGDRFTRLISRLEYKEIPLEKVNLYGIKTKDALNNLRKNAGDILSFAKDESPDVYGPDNIKYLLYDTKMKIAYYEHLSYKSRD